MLTVRMTPNLAGVTISGDYDDLQRLYDALTEIIGDESEPGRPYEMPALSILAICYELRHAWQGNRAVNFVANGLNEAVSQNLKTLGPRQNVYFTARIPLPEILFDVMALYDFIELYDGKPDIPALDRDIQMVQLFQAEVMTAVCSVLEDAPAGRLLRLVYGQVPRFRQYYTHYVEMLNNRYLRLNREKRLQQIVPTARRISERGADYEHFAADLLATAAELDCPVSELEPVSPPLELSDSEW